MAKVTKGSQIKPAQEYVDGAQLRTVMGWSYATFRTFLQRGLPHFRPGRKIYFRMDEVREWMNQFAMGRRRV